MPTATATTRITRDSEYYIECATFQVENKLFRVPKYNLLQQSAVFCSMLASLSGGVDLTTGATTKGTSDDNPIHLGDTRAEDFLGLLRMVHPLVRPGYKANDLTLTSGSGILKLATRWKFENIRKSLINSMTSLLASPDHALNQVLLGREHKVAPWLINGYSIFVVRDKSMTVAEGEVLGLVTVIRLNELRDCFARNVRLKAETVGPQPSTPTKTPPSPFSPVNQAKHDAHAPPQPNTIPLTPKAPNTHTGASPPPVFTPFTFTPSQDAASTGRCSKSLSRVQQGPATVEQSVRAMFKDEIQGW